MVRALERAATFQRYKAAATNVIEKTGTNNSMNPEYTSIEAYKKSDTRWMLFLLLSLLSLGIVPLVCVWFPRYGTFILREQVQAFRDCTHVLLTGPDGRFKEVQVQSCIIQSRLVRYFVYRKQRYIYDESYSSFVRVRAQLPTQFQDIHELRYGKTSEQASEMIKLYGENIIDIDAVPIGKMLSEKVLQPFYMFQIASVILWLFEEYYTYALVILFMSLLSVGWEVYSAKQNEIQLQSMTKMECILPVLRDGTLFHLEHTQLVVGDAIILSAAEPSLVGQQVPCDMILVQGECVMDESSLTGETVPVVKLPLPLVHQDTTNFRDKFKNNILFGGSKFQRIVSKYNWVQQSQVSMEEDEMCIAIVMSCGFDTAKGQLFRSILYPNQLDFKFKTDAYKFMLMLGCVAFVAFINRAINSYQQGVGFINALISSLDIITIAVPPALPLVLTVGIGVSLQRLKKHYIFCIDPERLNYCGQLNLMCWDKTGTLTVSELHFIGVDRVQHKQFRGLEDTVNFSSHYIQSEIDCIERVMISCHQVTNVDNVLLGHSLDIETVSQTNWKVLDSFSPSINIGYEPIAIVGQMTPKSDISGGASDVFILKRFEFDASLQCSSVICTTFSDMQKDAYTVYTKGSPEALLHLCKPETIPDNFQTQLQQYSIQGYYVIACAYRPFDKPRNLEMQQLRRKSVEQDLVFLGFMLYQNPLKEESKETISLLKQAQIRSIIITGDHALTAIHCCRELDLCQNALLIDVVGNEVKYVEIPMEQQLRQDEIAIQIERMEIQVKQPREIDDLINTLSLMPDQTEVAITGKALDMLIGQKDADYIDWIIGRARIFARTKPDQKTWIVTRLGKHGKCVAMCGDGTNDCGALKAAHVGLALSDAEASIVAPFTSAKKSVSDIVELVREGRCALETSFVSFRYMTLYPIIQLIMSATLNQSNSAMSNNQFFFDDMAIVTMLALFLLETKPLDVLVPIRPTDDLFHPTVLGSILGQVGLSLVFFATNFGITRAQAWFCSVDKATQYLDSNFNPLNGTDSYPCYMITQQDTAMALLVKSHENASIWLFSHFMLAIVPVSMSWVSHFRKPFWTNLQFMSYFAILFIVLSYLLLVPFSLFDGLFSIREGIPFTFRLGQFFLILAYFAISVVWEVYVVNQLLQRHASRRIQNKDWKRDRAVGINRQEVENLLKK
ncbi:hypothetical protein EDD86DRAFT_208692 [Gorgonomyces haynaldii]|nr:hypothetical protein EDD86DRAFT_208692 [Gorgonomyces haynaldii]